MAKPKETLELVKFQGEFFPLSESDYTLLCDHKVSVFRISSSTLEILSKVLLKGVKIEQHKWGTIYPKLLESFKKGLISSSAADTHQFQHEKNWIMVQTDTSDPKTEEDNRNVCSRYTNRLSDFMGRYGIRTKVENKLRIDCSLTKLTFTPDENIVPSFYFGCKEDHNSPIDLNFNLSQSARLKFQKRLNLNGEPTLGVSFEDRFGDHYEEAFVRAFPFKSVSVEDCEFAIEFFINLHSRLTNKSKKS